MLFFGPFIFACNARPERSLKALEGSCFGFGFAKQREGLRWTMASTKQAAKKNIWQGEEAVIVSACTRENWTQSYSLCQLYPVKNRAAYDTIPSLTINEPWIETQSCLIHAPVTLISRLLQIAGFDPPMLLIPSPHCWVWRRHWRRWIPGIVGPSGIPLPNMTWCPPRITRIKYVWQGKKIATFDKTRKTTIPAHQKFWRQNTIQLTKLTMNHHLKARLEHQFLRQVAGLKGDKGSVLIPMLVIFTKFDDWLGGRLDAWYITLW